MTVQLQAGIICDFNNFQHVEREHGEIQDQKEWKSEKIALFERLD